MRRPVRRRPRLADLFCGGGGAAVGYHRAGFEVVGFDVAPQPHYPFEFHQVDALAVDLSGFDAVHASPPCQFASRLGAWWPDREHVNLIPPTRWLLERAGVPWIMENVPEAVDVGPLRPDVVLCGQMFGLALLRHRVFELSGFTVPPLLLHPQHVRPWFTVTGQPGGTEERRRHLGPRGSAADWRAAMGIDWLPVRRLVQAIPPAYTEWLGGHLLAELGGRRAAG